ncbi:hypothetical protein E4J89_17205 [Arthrobacter sp. CAU 1506]|uniref:Rid family hydrolase n=1 Tax=Arthrobacter sp. CAU 1506 TaxID=2560052 RepID=UPI0010AC77AB|nr:Rid family hydrolase [Arthrobacter sp. CAU 1506]TJY66215.1 hypothetical protein E4J89_17205 [Arthrobacter sp. CAU 1506]
MTAAHESTDMSARAVGALGIGAMGSGMAARLLAAGFELHVLDGRATSTINRLSTSGTIRRHHSIQELAGFAPHVLTCLPTGEDVLAVAKSLPIDGEGRRAFIDCSTVGVSAVGDIRSAVESAGWQYVDAPVTGGPQRAAKGELLSYFAVDGRPRDGVREILSTFCTRMVELDSPGMGQLLKLANNAILLGLVTLNGYALTFAQSMGISPQEFAEITRDGAGDNWQLQNYLPTALEPGSKPGFALNLAHKDLRLVLDAAGRLGLDTTVLTSIEKLYDRASLTERGAGQRADFSAVIQELSSTQKGIPMPTTTVMTTQAPEWRGLPYPQAVRAGDFLFISGQLGVDLATGKPVGDAREQTRLIFEYLQEILAAADLSLDNVVKTTCFLTDRERDYDAFNDVYSTYLEGAARATVQVAALAPGCFVEVEAIAHIA